MDFIFYLQVTTLVHEIGHAAVMLALDVPFWPITFLPLQGAFVARKRHSVSVLDEALIAAGGPLAGTLIALWIIWLAHLFASELLLLVGSVAVITNISNMGAWGVLDGARIISVVSPFLSLGASAYVVVFQQNTLGEKEITLLVMGVHEQYARLSGDNSGLSEGYFQVSFGKKMLVLFCYLVLLGMGQGCLMAALTSFTGATVAAVAWSILCQQFYCYTRQVANRRRDQQCEAKADAPNNSNKEPAVDSWELNQQEEMELDAAFAFVVDDDEHDELQSDKKED